MARANQFQHLGAVAVNVLARLDAKKQVKEHLRAQGIRLTYVPACEIVAQTKQYLEAHPELYEQPCNARGKWACADLSHEQVAQTRALKRLNFLIQLLRFSVPRAY